jgi:hypothetical protein
MPHSWSIGTVNHMNEPGMSEHGSRRLSDLAVETDTNLAELYAAVARHTARIGSDVVALHRMAGHVGIRRRGMSARYNETLDDLRQLDRERLPLYARRQYDQLLAEVDSALAVVGEMREEMRELDDVWVSNGRWSRFFLVTNVGGHIHSSMACATCRFDTQFAWLPQLSALSEAEAVDAHGQILCSVCFPSAPTEWTSGESKERQQARLEREAAKKVRDEAKLAKALMPDGSTLVVQTNTGWKENVATLHAAKTLLADHFESEAWGSRYGTDAISAVAEAVSKKTGVPVDEVLADARRRAKKRR